MDHFPAAFPAWLAAILGAWMIIGFGVYLGLLRRVANGKGKVSASEFGLPDLFLGSLFVMWFGASIARGFTSPAQDVSKQDLIYGGAVFIAIVLVIGLFLRLRGVKAWRQFGVLNLNPFACAGLAVGLLLAAWPVIFAAEAVTQLLMKGKARPQSLVEFFQQAAQGSDRGVIVLTLLLGVVIAPICEETIFRGYLYGVLKRYCGGLGAALGSASLFAAMHLNGASLAPLFLLALCFTLAYEATGSLLVNVFMHALFNLSMFAALLWLASRGHAAGL